MAQTSTCPRCASPVRWAVTVAGARIAIDPTSHPDGVVVPVTIDGKLRAQVLTGDQLPAQTAAYRPHERTCPKGRDRARRDAATRPRCPWCEQDMDPWLTGRRARGHVLCMTETAWQASDLSAGGAA